MNDNPLFGVRVKIDRAKKHFRDLDAEVEAFSSGDPYKVILDEDSEPAIKIRRLHIAKEMPIHWSGVIGDIIHNLRSALDVLATKLVERKGFTSEDIIKRTYFPIGQGKNDITTRSKFKDFFDRVGDDVRDLILALEPYRGGKGEALWLLDRLDIIDKHRRIIPAWTRIAEVTAHPPPESGAESWVISDTGILKRETPLKHGDEIMRTSFFEPHFEAQTHFTFEIAFSETFSSDAYALMPTLVQLINFVEVVVDIFDRDIFE